MRALVLGLLLTSSASAQFQILSTPTTSDLRGIHAVSPDIAWASGTNGTVLRTTDAGTHWTLCPTPPDADHLDFRGIQAFDAQTAIVMSSGKGSLSRLYKTTNACATWTLVFTDPDPEGFWDALVASPQFPHDLLLAGDPVAGQFRLWHSYYRDAGASLHRPTPANTNEALFAASNSSVFAIQVLDDYWIGTGGEHGDRIIHQRWIWAFDATFSRRTEVAVPVGNHTNASGVFSLDFRPEPPKSSEGKKAWRYRNGIAVGGDYEHPDATQRTSVFTSNYGRSWKPSQTLPHGYRSSVAYSPATKTWITVGPNGTDISADDGRNWRPLRPSAAPDGTPDPPDADRNWNALSLPFVVGPHGRLRPTALR